jgi:stage II sporulation protein R
LFFYSDAVTNNISKNVFRLHVIANSNSEEDQDLKYKVRDELIKYMKSISSNISTKDEALTLVNNNLDTFQAIASNVIIENGFDYPVKIEVGNFDFPTKTYGDISLPAGFYDALKVEIGEAQGRNWWCVMFPSLCFVDVSNGIVPEESKENLQSNLDYEDYNLISSDEAEYKIKFKLVEILENAKIIMANKST